MDGEQKRIVLLARKEGLSFDQLMDHWTNIHAPLVAAIPAIRARRSCYVQNHLDRTVELSTPFNYDGITELFIKTPPIGAPFLEGLADYEAVKADERAQFDMARSINLTCTEQIVRPGWGNSKLVILLRRRVGVSQQDFAGYWRTVHAEAVIQQDRAAQRILGYVQNLAVPGSATSLDGHTIGDGEGFDGVSEVWFRSVEEARLSIGSLAYFDKVDSGNLIDRHSLQAHFFHERIIYKDDPPVHS